MALESLNLGIWDLVALIFFVCAWTLFTAATVWGLFGRVSLTLAMDRQRENWIRTAARRDMRMIDTSIMAGLQQGTAFFASTCIFAIGGCLALVGASERVMTVLADLPFVATASRGNFEIKVLGLVVVFAYAFFKFGWAYRLFNYCAILVGAIPVLTDDDPDADKAAARAAQINVLAGRHFDEGLQGIFFSIGYLGWFVGPAVFVTATLFVFLVLARRQFFSNARAAVLE